MNLHPRVGEIARLKKLRAFPTKPNTPQVYIRKAECIFVPRCFLNEAWGINLDPPPPGTTRDLWLETPGDEIGGALLGLVLEPALEDKPIKQKEGKPPKEKTEGTSTRSLWNERHACVGRS